MVDSRNRGKGNDAVAVLANTRSRDMRRRFTDRIDRVVAAGAVAGNIVVAEVCRHPAIGGMAIVAAVAALDMGARFAHRNDVVMAGDAAPEHLRVIDARDWREGDDRMAVFANICRQGMSRRLANYGVVVVAIDAVARNVVVTEIRRHPSESRVTVVASVSAWDVSPRLTDSDDVVVAGDAAPEHL